MNKNSVLNVEQKDFNKIVDEKTAIICINYNTNEFNNIMQSNYINSRSNYFWKLKKYNQIVFNIKFDNENVKSTMKIIKKIKRYAFFANLYKKKIGFKNEENNILANIKVVNNKENLYFSIISTLEAMTLKDKKERITYIYRQACKYLDKEIVEKNVCGFYNDKCFVKKDSEMTMGCCHHYPHKRTGIFRNEKLQLCEYQINKRCTANCLPCKLYMCDELRKKRI